MDKKSTGSNRETVVDRLQHAAQLGLDMAMANGLTNTAETIRAAMQCPCRGSDELCPCQNRPPSFAPDAEARLVEAAELPRAWLDVMGERVRQITVEGWTPEHDDRHVEGELAGAASAYAMSAAAAIQLSRDAPLREIPPFFMFQPCHWKPTNARRDLVKAGALILAEIERLDRGALAACEAARTNG